VSSGRHAIYIVISVFFIALDYCIIIDVAGSHEQKGVRLYGKYDYYLICMRSL
jgi:hypothetical protein